MGIPMRHLDGEGNIDIEVLGEAVDDHQFRTVWEPRGWERAPAEVAMVAESTGQPVTDLVALTKAELHEIAATHDIDVPNRATKDDIIGLLVEAPDAVAIAEALTEEA
jgi:hypothetical protein